MDLSRVQPALSRAGSIAAGLLILLTIAWIVLLVYPAPPSAGASGVERLHFISINDHWQVASFVVATLMAITYVPVWLALAMLIVPRRQTLGMIAAALGIFYGPVVVVGYWTQLNTVRGLNSLRETNTRAAVALAEAFDFSGNFWTGSYGIVIAGFVIWGLAMLIVFSGLIDMPYAPARTTAALYGVAGLLAIIGAVGFASGISVLEHGLMISGIVSIPALAGTAVVLTQQSNNQIPQTSAEPAVH